MSVEIKNLEFKYTGNKDNIINNLTLTFQNKKTTALLGPSGCGKSTLLRLIAGLELPQKGEIAMGQQLMVDETYYMTPEERPVGMVFQEYALFPHMTVEKNIAFGLPKHVNKGKEIGDLLRLIHMEGYNKRYPHELSGGQQQRVAIARALATKPKVLLLDEPFSNLDAALKGNIRKDLAQLIEKIGITVIFVTHDPEDAKALAHEVVHMKEGNVLTIESADHLNQG